MATYQEITRNEKLLNENITLVLCRDTISYQQEFLETLGQRCNASIVLIETEGQMVEPEVERKWEDSFQKLFVYTNKNAIEDGFIYRFIEDSCVDVFCIRLLKNMGFRHIQKDMKIGNNRYDIVAEQNGMHYFEMRSYKNLYASPDLVWKAITQTQMMMWNNISYFQNSSDFKEVQSKYYLILFCLVDRSIKQEALKRGIILWDISNLYYLCQNDSDLVNTLMKISDYSIHQIEMEKPLWNTSCSIAETMVVQDKENVKVEKKYDYYKKILKECDTGNEDGESGEYEKICTEIIQYLFGEQFSNIREQFATNDQMFRMDLLCTLKTGFAFWDFLAKYYRTKFIVFEFKNYDKEIKQNLIYTTEKYLYIPALRTVAFIISRKGFDKNAKKAAEGCLIENDKLIIDLTDDDMLYMVNLKDNGQEPSDYLMEKVEEMLSGISK